MSDGSGGIRAVMISSKAYDQCVAIKERTRMRTVSHVLETLVQAATTRLEERDKQRETLEKPGPTEESLRWVRYWLDLAGCTAPEAYEDRIHEIAAEFDKRIRWAVERERTGCQVENIAKDHGIGHLGSMVDELKDVLVHMGNDECPEGMTYPQLARLALTEMGIGPWDATDVQSEGRDV